MQKAGQDIDTFFADAPLWRDELLALRAILLATPLVEEFKWRAPCYTFEGRNVAIIGALKDRCVLSFFKGALMLDPDGLLVPPGENSRAARTISFTSLAEIDALQPQLRRCVDEAIKVERSGRRVTFEKDDLAYPEELTAILADDPALAAAFAALTPGRRRGYLLLFAEPKQAATRLARIRRSADAILAGKGRHDP